MVTSLYYICVGIIVSKRCWCGYSNIAYLLKGISLWSIYILSALFIHLFHNARDARIIYQIYLVNIVYQLLESFIYILFRMYAQRSAHNTHCIFINFQLIYVFAARVFIYDSSDRRGQYISAARLCDGYIDI